MFQRISSLTAGDRRISEPSIWSLNEPTYFWHLRATRMGHLGSNPPRAPGIPVANESVRNGDDYILGGGVDLRDSYW